MRTNLTRRCGRAALILILCGLLFPAKEISDVVRFSSKELDLYNVTISADRQGKETYRVADLTYRGRNIPYMTDLALSFNAGAGTMVKDDTGKYGIRRASYEPVKGRGELGGGGALFYKSDHAVEVETARSLWLGQCEDLGSFTLEFRFFPVSLKDGGILFSNTSHGAGRRIGIEVLVKNGRVSTRLPGLFTGQSGRRVDVFLNRGRVLSEKRWYHYALSFDRISGKLAVYTDGEEDEVVYATEKGEPFNGVFTPSFACEELPVAVIGKDFYGIMDEVRLSYRSMEELKKETAVALGNYEGTAMIERMPVNREGVITSPVRRFDLTGTKVISFGWNEELEGNSFIWMEFRISDDGFAPGDGAPRWYRVTNNQRTIYLKKEGDLYLRGKYYQWRAHLVPSPDGRVSPVFSGTELRYQLDPPPRPPLFLEKASSGDERVRLRWKKNVEHDILGYRVYYGINSRRYDGVLGSAGGKRITNETQGSRGYVELEIDNGIIEENRAKDPRGVLSYPLLKNNVLYFFAVSAYDSYRPDTPHNHESEPSKEVAVRPFAGSEITK